MALQIKTYGICCCRRRAYQTLIKKNNGNKSQVATELGIARSTLYRKLKNINKK
ncbi:MAG TPA: helix-turn-helix domain-containing protein [Syntrophomonadaceae bacterium]|nr:helix-turn-helix domain-containing protein [Syntrophomonadaceae bacterium]